MTRVADIMTRGVRALTPADTLQLAAQAMDELNVGALPICEGEAVVGFVTDRDITVRGVAQGLPGESTPLEQVMSRPAETCREGDPVEQVLQTMRERQIRRIAVLDEKGRLSGMLSLGDVAAKDGAEAAAPVLAGISTPAEPDRSGNSAASGSAGGGSASGEPSRMPP